jgi:transcriptional/translational regulatory protein YebC/TACO1
MQAQAGFTETPSTIHHNLLYKGGTFANLAVQEIQLHFFHDQLDMALVILKPTDNNAQTLDNLRSALTQKYGDWSGTTSAMLWKFQDTNTIMVTNKSGSIHLGYTDTDLFNAGLTESSTGINPSNL